MRALLSHFREALAIFYHQMQFPVILVSRKKYRRETLAANGFSFVGAYHEFEVFVKGVVF